MFAALWHVLLVEGGIDEFATESLELEVLMPLAPWILSAHPAPVVVAHWTTHVWTSSVFLDLASTFWALVDAGADSPVFIVSLILFGARRVAMVGQLAIRTGTFLTFRTNKLLQLLIRDLQYLPTISR